MMDKDTKRSILVEEMETFLRAGGSIDYETYSELGAETKAALGVASKRIAVENACLIGLAMEGEYGRALVRSMVYGSDDLNQLAVSAALDGYEAKVKP